MTFNEATHTLMIIAAGANFDWPTAGSRPNTDPRSGLFAFLKDYANGICAFCGQADENGEACHIVSGGKNRRGYVPGNLGYGCRACNEIDAEYGEIVSFESIRRPDLIPTEWPGMPELRRKGIQLKKESDNRKERIRQIRGL